MSCGRIGKATLAPIGLSCMSLSHAYGRPLSEADAIKLLHHALDGTDKLTQRVRWPVAGVMF